MKYSEIVRALECFAIDKDFDYSQCIGCAFEKKGICCENASEGIAKAALDLINYQNAEIKRLRRYDEERDIRLHAKLIATTRSEAIKEFAERLKTEIADALKSNYRAKTEHLENIEKYYKCTSCDLLAMIRGKIEALRGIDDYIDNLVKEMVGERE